MAVRTAPQGGGKVERPHGIFGVTAEFETADQLVAAARRTVAEGYTRIEGYSPLPVHGLAEVIGFKESKVQWTIFLSGVAGAIAGLSLQYWVSVIELPLNVGGRPLFSWPSFIPVTFECTILFASLAAFVSTLAYNGLPKPYHPIFNARNFERASQDRFFLCIEADDPKFNVSSAREFLSKLEPLSIDEVYDDDKLEEEHH